MTKGATNLVTAAPTLPAPKMPSAVPCLLGRIPRGHVGDADRERAAGDADAERGQQERRVVVGEGEQPGGDRRRQHHGGVDDAAAVLVGPDAEHQADQRAGQDRRADQQAELRIVEAEVLLDLDADDRKDRPHREADGEGERGHPQRAALTRLLGKFLRHFPSPPQCAMQQRRRDVLGLNWRRVDSCQNRLTERFLNIAIGRIAFHCLAIDVSNT